MTSFYRFRPFEIVLNRNNWGQNWGQKNRNNVEDVDG